MKKLNTYKELTPKPTYDTIGMKKLNTYKELTPKPTYDTIGIKKIVNWWNENYKNISDDEGWIVNQTFDISFRSKYINGGFTHLYKISTTEKYIETIQNHEIAMENARKYGWLVDYDGIVIGFDKEIFNKNIHLISGHELGLL